MPSQFHRAKDHGDYWRIVWRGPLRDVRETRSAVYVCLVNRKIRCHEHRAASTLVEIKIRQLERRGKPLSEEEKKELYESTKQTYDGQTDPRYGAARLWIDKIIDPMETRDALTTALEAAALNPDVPEFKVGVLQT
jgi:acetyl-CoA carboxylase carboxyltransferase component